MRNWIIEANQAGNLIKQENLSGMKDLLADIGSNRRLAAGMLAVDFKTPWDFLAKTNAEARSAEATSSANQIWWSIFKIVRTHFAAYGGGNLAKNSEPKS